MNNAVKHVDLLDYVRAIAILAVLSFHALGSTYGYVDLPWDGWLRNFSVPVSFLVLLPFSFGGAGVALFFVVSGFCIHLSFHQRGSDWRSFWIRRFFRIYPAYFAAIVFALACLMAVAGENLHNWPIWRQLLANVFLIHNLSPATFSGLNASFWSLAIEAQLYLVYPLLLLFVSRFGWRATIAALALCECLLRGADGVFETLNGLDTGLGRVIWTLAQSPLGYWFSWALGAWVAESFLKKQPFALAKMSAMPWLILAFASYFVRPIVTFIFPLVALITGIAISKILSGGSGVRIPARVSGSLRKIALWSYSIYLLHEPLLYIYSLVIGRVFPNANIFHLAAFFLFVSTFLIIIPISGLCYNAIELPGINLGKHLIQRRRAPPPQAMEGPAAPALIRPGPGLYLKCCAFLVAVAGTVFIGAASAPPTFDNELKLAMNDTLNHKFRDAIQHYYRALGLNQNSVVALNGAAWVLATAPDAGLRDGNAAVVLATRACELTQYQEPVFLGTLAAAEAEAGDFQNAIATARKAQALAATNGLTQVAEKSGEMIQLYKAGKPFHETPAPGS
ncbi:MAG TPA: acyltransferase family protein [Alphaproteobacteria bacterium]|nr:acyltransferase family protein [Alphaproteobacteria bacterium]